MYINREETKFNFVHSTHAIGKSEVTNRKYFQSYSNLIFRGFWQFGIIMPFPGTISHFMSIPTAPPKVTCFQI